MIAIFVGPSLARERVDALLQGVEALVLPPAAQGDIYRAARRRPSAIGLVDGYFGEAPAVWHKEILWALHEGIPVLGAASMGALRAAELEPFGMTGIGAIFEAYRDGVLVDDDEVALCHAPADLRYAALSEPMVNIRATFAAAYAAGVIPLATMEAATSLGRQIHYPERSYDELVRRLAGEGHELGRFVEWLRTGRVDQKALDAEALLRAISAGVALPSSARGWHFEHTAMWEELVRTHRTSGTGPHASRADGLLRELQSGYWPWREAMVAAMGGMLASDAARREGKQVDDDELLAALQRLRSLHGLETPEQLEAWLEANDLDTDGLIELLGNQVRLEWMIANLQADLEPHVLQHLKVTGAYSRALSLRA